MHRWVRAIPWSLALLGLVVPLVVTGLVVWPVVAVWLKGGWWLIPAVLA